MIFRCTKCKTEPEFLTLFGKFIDNKAGMEDEGEYCEDCFNNRCEKYGIVRNLKKEENNIPVVL